VGTKRTLTCQVSRLLEIRTSFLVQLLYLLNLVHAIQIDYFQDGFIIGNNNSEIKAPTENREMQKLQGYGH
jgi:hypothetical protein